MEASFFSAPWQLHPSTARGSPCIVQGIIRKQLSKHINLPPLAHLLLRIAALPEPLLFKPQEGTCNVGAYVRDSLVLLADSPRYRQPTWKTRGGRGSPGRRPHNFSAEP